ncbi:MAG: hypothetical protein KAS32_13510 [Candidatus Peribacteraceae bacterium]|nr:hypothetical protein [Candidatus Peribacteraceae bacterium]
MQQVVDHTILTISEGSENIMWLLAAMAVVFLVIVIINTDTSNANALQTDAPAPEVEDKPKEKWEGLLQDLVEMVRENDITKKELRDKHVDRLVHIFNNCHSENTLKDALNSESKLYNTLLQERPRRWASDADDHNYHFDLPDYNRVYRYRTTRANLLERAEEIVRQEKEGYYHD